MVVVQPFSRGRSRNVVLLTSMMLGVSLKLGKITFIGQPFLRDSQPEQAAELTSNRRAVLSLGTVSLLELALNEPAIADLEPLPPPVIKDLKRAAPKIQEGIDWMYFELLDSLKNKNLEKSRKALGSSLAGSYVSPLESLIILPLNQICTANLDAEEDGWVKSVRGIEKAINDMSDQVGRADWTEALASWNAARDAANSIMNNINQRSDSPVFVLVDDSYEDRRGAYIQKKKDELAFRNAAGTLALR